MSSPSRRIAAAIAVLLGASALAVPAQAAPTPLVGTFAITAGSCSGGAVSGTYLRMVLPTGTTSGPYLANADAACDDQTYTPLAPGTDGGLVTGGYQSNPSPAFDGNGNSLAGRITAPTGFFGVAFSTSTNATDPQTGRAVPAPVVTVDGTTLTGDLTAFAASWNDQEFNQGAPKPGGGLPGNTTIAHGTYDPATGAFTLEWASQVEGGPFDRFTGLWHLEGRFVPADASAAAATADPGAPAAGDGTAAPGGGATPAGAATPAAGAAPGAPTAAPGSTAAPAAAPTAAAPTGGAAPTAAAPSATVTRPGEDGWAPPGWLVGLVAAIGLLALGTYVGLERTLRRLEGGIAVADAAAPGASG